MCAGSTGEERTWRKRGGGFRIFRSNRGTSRSARSWNWADMILCCAARSTAQDHIGPVPGSRAPRCPPVRTEYAETAAALPPRSLLARRTRARSGRTPQASAKKIRPHSRHPRPLKDPARASTGSPRALWFRLAPRSVADTPSDRTASDGWQFPWPAVRAGPPELVKFLAGWDASGRPPSCCLSVAAILPANSVPAIPETDLSLDQPFPLPLPGTEILGYSSDGLLTTRSRSILIIYIYLCK